MNVRLSRLIIITIVPFLFVLFGLNSRDATAGVAKPPPPTTPGAPNGLLSQAYAVLSVSDRGYHGHRVRAMRQIAAAAKELGVTLQGNGRGKEQRVVSDEQLLTAQHILQQALPGLPPNAKTHVEKALEELSIALSLK
jgi:hypothetical protein